MEDRGTELQKVRVDSAGKHLHRKWPKQMGWLSEDTLEMIEQKPR